MPSLDDLRREIDRIDDGLHDLLMSRARIVDQIRESKASNSSSGPFLRPGREAQVIRRLIARHQGPFPKKVVARLWREIMSTFTAMQGPFVLAVFVPEDGDRSLVELAHEHYGTYTKTVIHRSKSHAIRAVTDGQASVAILPFPSEDSTNPWWINLMGTQADRPRIIARLPFVGRSEQSVEAVAVARLVQEETGDDKSWLGLETLPDISRARLSASLKAAGFENAQFLDATRPVGSALLSLVEVPGCILPEDPRLALLDAQKDQSVLRAIVLGGYASPLPAGALSASPL